MAHERKRWHEREFTASALATKGYGSVLSPWNTFKVVLFFGVIISGVVAVGYAVVSVSRFSAAAPASATSTPQIRTSESLRCSTELLDWKADGDEFSNFITGHIKNSGTATCDYVEVRFTVYDYKGESVQDHVFTNVEDLGPGQKWQFKVLLPDGTHHIRYDRIVHRN